MAMEKKQNQPDRGVMSGLERLSLRVSSMINHPIAQIQRWVTIHQLDTDGDREWEEVMGQLSETECIDMTFNADESVTLRWEEWTKDDRTLEIENVFEAEELEPF